MARTIGFRRSRLKAVTCRIIVMCLHTLTIYLFTGKVRSALSYTLVGNVYT